MDTKIVAIGVSPIDLTVLMQKYNFTTLSLNYMISRRFFLCFTIVIFYFFPYLNIKHEQILTPRV